MLRPKSFFITAISKKNCLRYKAVKTSCIFKIMYGLYWIMYQSPCGLIRPLEGYTVQPVFFHLRAQFMVGGGGQSDLSVTGV
jgi:hypothetical protein